jgi:murein DD-endopeptidase MepM/ murein hydrolase activator NlpD
VYSVSVGDSIKQGQVIGFEWNNGNTVDFQGRSCRGRDCGYHSHLNIYDKTSGSNINPLDWIPLKSP